MSRVFIIAEAGTNHNGRLKDAYRLVDAAVDARADAVKFQTFRTHRLVSRSAPKAEYQKHTTAPSESQYDMLKRLELSETKHEDLYTYCHEKGIQFLSTPFDEESLDFLVRLGLDTIKIPSGEITNLPFLKKIGRLNKQIIMSTGMSDLNEVESALHLLVSSGTNLRKIAVLHCTTEYPAPFEDVNLKAMLTIREKFGVRVGYSDHTLGCEVPIAAVAMGARIIEKHFTLSRHSKGPDHAASLEPDQLKQMVTSIRNIEKAMGSGKKCVSPSEAENRSVARKSIVAAERIRKGERFTAHNLTVKRPGTGISPMLWEEITGKRANRDYHVDEAIEL